MRRKIWRLVRRVFHQEYCEDVGAPLLRAYELHRIDSIVLHQLDAALKYDIGPFADPRRPTKPPSIKKGSGDPPMTPRPPFPRPSYGGAA